MAQVVGEKEALPDEAWEVEREALSDKVWVVKGGKTLLDEA